MSDEKYISNLFPAFILKVSLPYIFLSWFPLIIKSIPFLNSLSSLSNANPFSYSTSSS